MTRLLPSALAPSRVVSLPGSTAPQPDEPPLGHPGSDPKHPVIVLAVMDHSYSVTGLGGADPIGRRFEELTRAIRHVARHSKRGTHVGLLSFDQPSSGDVPPGVIGSVAHRRLLERNLRVPLDARGSSSLGPSLAVAEQVARDNPTAEVWFVPISDFALTDLSRADLVPCDGDENVGGVRAGRGGRGDLVAADADGDVAERAQGPDDLADAVAGGLLQVA